MSESDKKKGNTKAMALLCVSIDDGLIPIVRDLKNAKEIWEALDSEFAAKGAQVGMQLFREYSTLKFKKPVREYCRKLKELSLQVAEANAELAVSETSFCLRILESLPHSFSAIREHIYAADMKGLSFITLCERLELAESRMRKEDDDKKDDRDESSVESLYTAASHKTTKKFKGKSKDSRKNFTKAGEQCGRCGNNHPDKPCPALDKVCRKCGKKGHFEKMCRTKIAESHFAEVQVLLTNLEEPANTQESWDVCSAFTSCHQHFAFMADSDTKTGDDTTIDDLNLTEEELRFIRDDIISPSTVQEVADTTTPKKVMVAAKVDRSQSPPGYPSDLEDKENPMTSDEMRATLKTWLEDQTSKLSRSMESKLAAIRKRNDLVLTKIAKEHEASLQEIDSVFERLQQSLRKEKELAIDIVKTNWFVQEKTQSIKYTALLKRWIEEKEAMDQLFVEEKVKLESLRFEGLTKTLASFNEACEMEVKLPKAASGEKSSLIASTPSGRKGKDSKVNPDSIKGEDVLLTSSDDSKFQEKRWFIDSGASMHITYDGTELLDIDGHAAKVNTADGTCHQCSFKGRKVLHGADSQILILKDVLLVEGLRRRLISVPKLLKDGYELCFRKNVCSIMKDGTSVFSITEHEGLFSIIDREETVLFSKAKQPARYWHHSLGHLGLEATKATLRGVGITDLDFDFKCGYCIQGKMTKAHFPKSASRSGAPLELIHSDLCGPMDIESKGRKRYFVTYTDDFSRYRFIYFLHKKSDQITAFRKFKALAENITGRKIKVFRTDNGGEFLSGEMTKLLSDSGILLQTRAPYTPEQNGVAERTNRTIMDGVRSMLCESGLPKSFWAEAANAKVYAMNYSFHKSISGIPFELWTGRKVSELELGRLRPFGIAVFYKIEKPSKKKKLSAKAAKGKFLGYSSTSKAYRILTETGKTIEVVKIEDDPDAKLASTTDKKVENAVSGDFELKEGPPFTVRLEDEVLKSTESYLEDVSVKKEIQEVPTQEVVKDWSESETKDVREIQPHEIAPKISPTIQREPMVPITDRRSTPRSGAIKPLGTYKVNRTIRRTRDEGAFFSSPEIKEPQNYEEAIESEHSERWKEAMQSEWDALNANGTFDVISREECGDSIIGVKWVFKVKLNADGTIERFKARLVAKGFTQQEGIDYQNTFAPVIGSNSVKLMLALSVIRQWKLFHLDISNAFLNGKLEEVIFVEIPKGLDHLKRFRGKALRLRKALYGLKQAAERWHFTFTKSLQNLGFVQLISESCMFVHVERPIIIGIYVDDVIVLTPEDALHDWFLMELSQSFKIRSLGIIEQILGLKITYVEDGLHLSLPRYIQQILTEYGMIDCKPVGTPISAIPDMRDEGDFRKDIGKLLYAALACRPDIAFAVGVISRKPTITGIKRVLRYLRGTIHVGLFFQKNMEGKDDDVLHAAVDADWAQDLEDRKSITAFQVFFGKCLISYKSKKQSIVATSSTSAEYIALAEVTKEVLFLRNLLKEIGLEQKSPTIIQIDNRSALLIASNSAGLSLGLKHLDVKYHFLRDHIEKKEIELQYVMTEDNPADILTKPLSIPRLNHLKKIAGILDVDRIDSSAIKKG